MHIGLLSFHVLFFHKKYQAYFISLTVIGCWRRNEFESGSTGPERKWGGAPIRRRKKIFCRALHFFVLKAQLVGLVSAFVAVSTV